MVKIYELDSPSDDQSLESVTNFGHEKTKDIKGGSKSIYDVPFDWRIIREGPPPIDDWIHLVEGPLLLEERRIVREGPQLEGFRETIQDLKRGFHPGHLL